MIDELKAWTEEQAYDRGYQKGRDDALNEYISILKKELEFYDKHGELIVKLAEQLKEQKNDSK